MASREKLDAIRAKQDENDAIANEVRDRLSKESWDALIAYNTYHSAKFGQKLEFYRNANGKADYRFRAETAEEKSERISDYVEDNI